METNLQQEFCLLSWGANSYGQLGQGHVADQSEPRFCDSALLQNRAVRAVGGGGGHSVFITENGEVYVCGQNNRGQLGCDQNANILTLQFCPTPSHKLKNVACGWDFTLFLTDGGQVLACGSNSFGQLGVGAATVHSAQLLVVEGLKKPVVSVAAGLRHSLAVTDSGHVYQWGTGLFRSQCPPPVPSHLSSKVPCLVPDLDQKTPRVVAAGSAHCVYLTDDGDLFLWGSNRFGQLATTQAFHSSPIVLKRSLFKGEKVKSVWSGWTHIVAQTESGRVFTWGRGAYGQLGRATSNSQDPEQQAGAANQEAFFPSEVETLFGATQVACGSEHNLAIVVCQGGRRSEEMENRPHPSISSLTIHCIVLRKSLLLFCVSASRS
uniref:Secretion regulating guanine nucleotide exchange factor n=1 Tax=Cynoglossus semilaevis TaxID=244447 RepID=A0A3P8V3F1_CYNSE